MHNHRLRSMTALLLSSAIAMPAFAGYESERTRAHRTEVAKLENELWALRADYDALRSLALHYQASADLIGKAALEAELKKMTERFKEVTRQMVDVSGAVTSIGGSVKEFLKSIVEDVLKDAITADPVYTGLELPKGAIPSAAQAALDEIGPIAAAEIQRAVQEAESRGTEEYWKPGTFNYQYTLISTYTRLLKEQENKLREKARDYANRARAKRQEMEGAGRRLAEAKKRLADQLAADGEITRAQEFNAQVAAEEAERERQRKAQADQAAREAQSPGAGAAAINFEQELNDIRSAADKLKANNLTADGFRAARDGAASRASSKSNARLEPPRGMNDAQRKNWLEEQRKALNDKYEAFRRELQSLEAGLKARAQEISKDLNSMYESARKAGAMNIEDWDKRAGQGYPRLGDVSDRTKIFETGVPDYAHFDMLADLKRAVESDLAGAPKRRKHLADTRQHVDRMNAEFAQAWTSAARAYNDVVKGLNESYKNHVHLLTYAGLNHHGASYRPEAAEGLRYGGSRDWAGEERTLAEREATLAADKAAIELGEESYRAAEVRSVAFAERSTKVEDMSERKVRSRLNSFLGNRSCAAPAKDEEWCVEIGVMEQSLGAISAGSVAQALEALSKEADLLALDFSGSGAAHSRFFPLSRSFNTISAGYRQRAREYRTRAAENRRKDPNPETPDYDQGIGQLLKKAQDRLAAFKVEEGLLRADLGRMAAKVEGVKAQFESVSGRDPAALPADPATRSYFTPGARPTGDYAKINAIGEDSLSRGKDKNFNYFGEWGRAFLPGPAVRELRAKIFDSRRRIQDLVWESVGKFEPPRIASLTVDTIFVGSNLDYPLVLYRMERPSDRVEVRGSVDRADNLAGVEVSLDGGATWRGNDVTVAGALFSGQVRLTPDEPHRLKVRAKPRHGGDAPAFPEGKGFSVTYSTVDPSQDIRELIKDLFAAYEDESLFAFMRLVSDDFTGQRENMEAAVRRDFAKYDNIRLKPYVDRITASPADTSATVELHWDRNWLNTTTSSPETTSGRNTFRVQKENNRWRLASLSGTPVFGITAASGIENPNPSGLVVRTGQVVISHMSGGTGFSFVTGGSADPMSSTMDMEYFGGMVPPGLNAPYGIYYFGIASWEAAPTAPSAGYATSDNAVSGGVYFFKCSNGNYAKMRITDLDNDRVVFDWAYQPDGTGNFR